MSTPLKATEARLSDSDRNAREARERLRHKQEAQLKRDLNETFSTPAGRRSLFWLMQICGYQRPSVVADPQSGEVVINSTVYNEARRNLYLTLRSFLTRQILTDVELRGTQSEDSGLDLFQ